MNAPEKLDSTRIKELLCRGGARVTVYDTVDSTNNEAKRLLEQWCIGEAVIAAEEQTAGRGRQGKSFYSPSGSGLYMTLILRPEGELCDFTLMTSAAAVAVSQAIESVCGIETQIKWVNDILIGGKKVVGILTEAVSAGGETAVIVGIGVNITTEDFPQEIRSKAASVGEGVSRNILAAEIAKRLFALCDKLPHDKSYMQHYRSRSCVLGRRIAFAEGGIEYSAAAESIDDGGGLWVVLDSGERRLLCGGEISVKPI